MKSTFNPVITRVKLNPEQAVLFCTCYDGAGTIGGSSTSVTYCSLARSGIKGWRTTCSPRGVGKVSS